MTLLSRSRVKQERIKESAKRPLLSNGKWDNANQIRCVRKKNLIAASIVKELGVRTNREEHA